MYDSIYLFQSNINQISYLSLLQFYSQELTAQVDVKYNRQKSEALSCNSLKLFDKKCIHGTRSRSHVAISVCGFTGHVMHEEIDRIKVQFMVLIITFNIFMHELGRKRTQQQACKSEQRWKGLPRGAAGGGAAIEWGQTINP